MRMVTGHNWGADRLSLINIYKALIRLTIDYGCIMYSSACKTSLKKIERMQFKALRIALGDFKTTHTSALLVESKETPINLRYEKLSLNYWVRLKGSFSNPALSVCSDCWEYSKKFSGFGWKIDNLVNHYGLKELKYGPALALSGVPPWLLPHNQAVITYLLEELKMSFADADSEL